MLFYDDVICSRCRNKFDKVSKDTYINDIPYHYTYRYTKSFSDCLVQYKELYDEALKDVFMYDIRKKFKRKYRGYTLLLMPSSEKRIQQRGFHHLKEMVSCLDMDVLEPFEKIVNVDQKKSGAKRKLMQQGIALKEGIELPYKILLFDDVYTSGATIQGALSCIDVKRHDIKIYTCSKVEVES